VFSDFGFARKLANWALKLNAASIRLSHICDLLTFNKQLHRLHACPGGSTGGFKSHGPRCLSIA
jgi:hypothetical protein